ncbi:MAG: lysylphosphatidylglycerol synthase transmembrane domain-containing protein [Spirochaetota bacterium]
MKRIFKSVKDFLKKYFKFIFYIFILAGIGIYLYLNKGDLTKLLELKYQNMILLFIISSFVTLMLAVEYKYTMYVFNIKLRFKEWFGLTIINTMFNLFMPARSGMVVRAMYLKNRYDFSYSHYVSLIAGSYVIFFYATGIVGLILSIILYMCGIYTDIKIILIFTGLLGITIIGTLILFIFIKANIKLKSEKINNAIIKIKEGLNYFKNNKKLIFIISGLHLLFYVFMGLRLYWVYKSIGVDVEYTGIYIVVLITGFSMIISLTPGNIGIKEGIIGLSATLLGIPLNIAILGAAIDRIVEVIIVLILGSIFSRILLKDIKV